MRERKKTILRNEGGDMMSENAYEIVNYEIVHSENKRQICKVLTTLIFKYNCMR